MLKVSLFGTPRITLDEKPIKVSRRKALALFCYLVTRDQPVSRDTLAALLWSDYNTERARADLRVSLWAINKAIGDDYLLVDRDTIQLNPEKSLWLDVNIFQEAMQAPLTHHHHPDEICVGCLPHFEAAHTLYTDDFLAGFTIPNSPEFEDWQLMEAEALRLSYQQALQKLVLGYSALQQLDSGMQYAQRWLGLDPFNEEAHRGMMALQMWSGNKAGALQQYHACEQILEDELDVPPSDETNQLYEVIKSGILPDIPFIYYDEVTPTIAHNLPPQPNPFRGRGEEVAQLSANLKNEDCRLLTITGLGGAGKTRLSLHTARQMLTHFPDGVFFVSLMGAFNRYAIITDIADAIGLQFMSKEAQETQLLTHLASKKMMLILDNFEHLTEHITLIENILMHAPDIKLLVTSRIPLNLKAEWVFTLDRMTEGAEQLFMDSAARVERHFIPDQVETIRQICEQLAGVPLAIELAATWVRVLNVSEILEEIQHNKEALETDWHDIPERQRSLQATFNYSWELLSDINRQALARLAIFPGSFNHQAAKSIADVRVSSLSTLAAQVLIKRNAQGRYELHTLIRQFALEKLRQSTDAYAAVTHSFIRYFNQLLADHLDDLRGEAMLGAKASLLLEIDSIRAACVLAIQHQQADFMLDGLPTLAVLYDYMGWYEEARSLFETYSRAMPHHPQRTLRARIYWGKFARLLGDYAIAKNILTQAVEHAQPYPEDMAAGYIQLCYVDYNQDHEQAFNYAQKALEVYEELNHPLGKGMVLRTLAEIRSNTGLVEEGIRYAQESLKHLMPLGKILELAPVYRTLSRLYMHQGNYADALTHGRTAVELYKFFDFKEQLIRAQTMLAGIQDRIGQYDDARVGLEEAIKLADRLNFEESLTYALLEYGTNAYYRKAYPEAADALERALNLSYKLNMGIISDYLKINLSNVLIDMEQYGRAEAFLLEIIPTFEAANNHYGMAVSGNMLGKNLLATRRFEEARTILKKNIQLSQEHQLISNWLTAICYMGELEYALGHYEDAVRLIEFVIQHEATESSVCEEAIEYREKITLELGKERVRQLLAQVDLGSINNIMPVDD